LQNDWQFEGLNYNFSLFFFVIIFTNPINLVSHRPGM